MTKAEGGRRKAGERVPEGGRRKAEGRMPEAEGGRRKAEERMPEAEGGRRKAEERMPEAEGERRKAEGGRAEEAGGPFEALRAALAVTPSRDFEVRVRERVRLEPRALSFWRWPRLAFAGSLVAALVVATVVWRGQTPSPTGPRPDREVSASRLPAAPGSGAAPSIAGHTSPTRIQQFPAEGGEVSAGGKPIEGTGALSTIAGALDRPGRGAAVAATPATPRAHATDARPSVRPAALEVLVPDDQRRALDRLLVAIREGNASVPPPPRFADAETSLAGPPPIDIPLLEPIQPLPITLALDSTGSEEK